MLLKYPDYKIEDVYRQPIVFGEPVKWDLTLSKGEEQIKVLHETPAIFMEIQENSNDDFWFKDITLKTNFTQGYSDVIVNVKVPKVENTKIKSIASYTLEDNQELKINVPVIEDKRTIKLKGLKQETLQDRIKSFGSKFFYAGL